MNDNEMQFWGMSYFSVIFFPADFLHNNKTYAFSDGPTFSVTDLCVGGLCQTVVHVASKIILLLIDIWWKKACASSNLPCVTINYIS